MVTRFDTHPDFAHYSNIHLTTQNIAKYYDVKSDAYRGFVTHPLSMTHKSVGSPIVMLINKSEAHGNMMYFHQIQEEPNSPYYMDVWFMNSNPDKEIIKRLESLRSVRGTKCCWSNTDTGKSLGKYFTGYARIVEYADYQRNGASPEYAFKISEGQIKNGKTHGFARVISGFDNGSMEFGWYNSDDNSIKALVDSVIRNSDFDPATYR